MENQKIGNFIKELRKEKNLTQKELADKLFKQIEQCQSGKED